MTQKNSRPGSRRLWSGTDPSPVPLRLVKAPERDTLSPGEKAIDSLVPATPSSLEEGSRGVPNPPPRRSARHPSSFEEGSWVYTTAAEGNDMASRGAYMRKIQRREFLQTAGVAAALWPAGTAHGTSESAAPPVRARLLSGCCAYSYYPYLETGRMTMEEFILRAAGLGIVGADMTAYWLKSTEPAYLVNLRHLAFKNGLPISGPHS